MSRFSELKASGTGCARFSNSPIMGHGGYACGGEPQAMPHGDVVMELSSAFIGVVTGAVATIIYHGFADKWEVKATIAREVRYRERCVKEYQSGWSFDRCQRDANQQAQKAEKELMACVAVTGKQNATIAEIEEACQTSEGNALP